MKKIVIAGGTGNLGKILTKEFLERGDEVFLLSREEHRSDHPALHYVLWDGEQLGDWVQKIEGADVLINLTGLSINRVFNEKNKALLLSSRVVPTSLLGKAIGTMEHPPKKWINASGVSIFNGRKTFQDETSTDFGHDFLAELAKKWEAACLNTLTPDTQKVIIRISPVLMQGSGMFAELYPLAKFGLAGKVGDGQQMVSWIHHEDFKRLLLWIADLEKPDQVYHACSPNPVSNADFMKAIRKAAHMPIGLPLPVFMAKIGARFKGVDASLLLETVPVTTILTSQRGFTFKFPYIQPAISDLADQST